MKRREFRSDTLTMPTEEMRNAMRDARVGDDVYDEDPTVNHLQEVAAKKVGKEAALFFPSGTAGNQCAIGAHIVPGNEVIVSENTHVLQHEAGAAGALWGAQVRTVAPAHATYLTNLDILPRLRTRTDVHEPDTKLILLENSLSDGSVMPLGEMGKIRSLALEHRVKIHLDGARLFNAALALDVGIKEIVDLVDSVMFCLSKGLGAPIGSILAGDEGFIALAKKKRKMTGGGMRQVGVLAAPALIALSEGPSRLPADHANAKRLAQLLSKIPIFEIDETKIDTNILFFHVESPSHGEQEFVDFMRSRGFNMNDPMLGGIRVVTSSEIDEGDVRMFADSAADFFESCRK